jgi:hypothetical protein
MKSAKVILFVTLLLFFSGASVAAEANKDNVIKVSGVGKIEMMPDSFSLVVFVESESVSLKRATSDNAEKAINIIQEVKQLNIPNIEFSTSVFNFRGEKGSIFLSGKKYNIENEITIKAERVPYNKLADYASSVIDAVVSSGASRIWNFKFYLKDTNSVYLKALKEAVSNAKSKALIITQETGVNLKKPINITLFQGGQGVNQIRSRNNVYDELSFSAQNLQVMPGKESFVINIEIDYLFE